MNLIKCFQTNSTCYQNTDIGIPVGVLWHDTGAGNPYLKRYVQPLATDNNYNEMIALLGKNKYNNDWNHTSQQAGLNGWIGKLEDGSIATIQSMPLDYKPWGCGSGGRGSLNMLPDGRIWVQFEICDDSYTDKDYFNKVYKEACEFTAYICQIYNIDPRGTVSYNGLQIPTILCHRDSADFGLGSYHADVRTWFKKFGKTMDDVRQDVYNLIHKTGSSTGEKPVEKPVEKPETKPEEKPSDIPVGDLSTYSKKVNAICELALSEVGYKEKKTNDQLYNKTANAGNGNYTKYAYEIDKFWPDFYNETVNGKDGCSSFVDWLFIRIFGKENAQKMLYYPKQSEGADCAGSANYFRNRNKFMNVPLKGDKVFFGDYGAEGHTGIVVDVDGSVISVVENNTRIGSQGDGVYLKQYDVSQDYIPGYGRPNYSIQINQPESEKPSDSNSSSNSNTSQSTIAVGALVTIKSGSTYYGTTKEIPQWVINNKWYVSSINGDRVVLGYNETKKNNINSPVNVKDLNIVGGQEIIETQPEPEQPQEPDSNTNVTIELPVLQMGSSGKIVENVQNILMSNNIKLPTYGADGDFGGETELGVVAYQKKKGINQTGKVDKETWIKLLTT